MAETAIGICCRQVGKSDPFFPRNPMRLVSREIKKIADEVLMNGHITFRMRPSMPLLETDLGAKIEALRRLNAALGSSPERFIHYTMVVDCNAGGTALIAPPLSFLAQLCTIGIRIKLTVRVVGKQNAGISSGWQRETVSLDTVVPLPNVTRLYVSEINVTTASMLHWLLSCCGGVSAASGARGQIADGELTSGLEAFTYMGRTLAEQDMAALMGQLARLNLKSLAFDQDNIKSLVLKELPALTSLTKLDLSKNNLRRSAELFATVLAPLTHIRDLNLASNRLSSVLGTIASAFPPALTRLDLSANGLGDNISATSDLLSRLPALTSLNLSFNALCDKGAQALPLSRLTALTMLDIQNNDISSTWTPGVPWLVRCGSHKVGDTVKGFCSV